MSTNFLSTFGRLSYSVHMLFYPTAFVLYQFAYKPYAQRQAEKAAQKAWDELPQAKPVRKDLFNPFTPIPYHNNEELKYSHEHIDMLGYVNEHHINVGDYPWKGYHDVYDHDNERSYYYNWTSIHDATH